MFGQVMDSNVLPDKNGSKTQGADRRRALSSMGWIFLLPEGAVIN